MLVDITKVRAEDRIRKDFGNIEELATDIKENGLINPPVVIPEEDGTFTLLAGERRLRAMKFLGYQQIEVRTWKNLSDEEKLNVEISENEVRKDFSKAERIDYARRLERIEAAKARERKYEGRNQYSSHMENFPYGKDGTTRDTVASKLGIGSGKQYEREKFIVDNQSSLTPEDFADWDEGRLSTNKAFNRIKEKLKAAEEKNAQQQRQLDLMQKNEMDLRSENNRLRNQPQKIQTVEVVPDDYEETKERLAGAKKDYKELHGEYEKMTQKWQSAEQKLRDMQASTPEQEFNQKLKRETIYFCSGVATFIKENGGYVWIAEHINELPEQERRGYISAVKEVYSWAVQMMNNLGITE